MIKKSMNGKSAIYLILAAAAIILIIIVMYGAAANKKLNYNYFYKGVCVEGTDISGMTKEQAYDIVSQEFEKNYYKDSISLVYNDRTWIIPLKSIDFKFDMDTALNNAYKIGRSGNKFSRLATIGSIKKHPVNLIVQGKYSQEKLEEKLNIIKEEIDFSGINSTYDYNYGKIIYTNAVNGLRFDLETNEKLIEAQLLNRNFNDVFLEVQIVKPLITVEDVKDLRQVLGTFTTRFNENNYGRSHNIELAAEKINNFLLLPGEEFSMDRALGPRTPGNGYMQAPIIMKSRVVPGTGGGVCQVATTLYNAVLLSMLQVTNRVNHSMPLGYVPPGQDATISEGYIDLKFRNNKDYTICIATQIKGGSITIKIIGKKTGREPSAVLRPVVIGELLPPEPEYVINDGLADNEVRVSIKGRKGLKVVLYRDTYDSGGKLLGSEKISEDFYKPVRGKLAVNRKTFEYLKNN